MPEAFLHLLLEEQAEIVRAGVARLGRTALVLEKDVWICWALQRLFEMPGRPQMVFKGGTSLSKVFDAIRRFSEDVDITIDHRNLAPRLDPFLPGLSGTQRRKISEELRDRVRAYTNDVVKPYFQNLLREEFGSAATVSLSEDGEQMHIPYQSAVESGSGYGRVSRVRRP